MTQREEEDLLEVLRRAVEAIRDGYADLEPGYRDPFPLAVADWLESEGRAIHAYLVKQADPTWRFSSLWTRAAEDRHKHALTVARAYLRESA